MIKNRSLIERFLRYVKIDTQSADESETSPSTMKQHDLAALLARELTEMGAADVYYDKEHCYVYATVPGYTADSDNRRENNSEIGLIAHMDTATAVTGANVCPRIIENYDGNDEILKTEQFPELLQHIGEDLIATNGKTLLGADDKAGVAEIMETVRYYMENPQMLHKTIHICFTPDEEVGRGTDYMDLVRFGAKEAYTVDGGKLGELEYENFNAAYAKISVHGVSVHPGDAKNRMKNAVTMAMEFQSMLPAREVPEHTEGYEGFYFPEAISGDVELTVLEYIIRDHDREKFEQRKKRMIEIAAILNEKYGSGSFTVEMKDQYYNMLEIMKEHMHLIEDAGAAFARVGVTAVSAPIRGGTDGAMLTYKGIPCPNLCTGGYNYHSRYEYASIQEMEKCAEMLIELVRTGDGPLSLD